METAEIAIQSSLTGHLVFSTLHTNDAPSAVTRLVDMGVEPYLVSSAVIGVLAQRLIRLLCPIARLPINLGQGPGQGRPAAELLDGHQVYKPVGCDKCFETGYRGRAGLYELLKVSDEVQKVLAQTSEANDISAWPGNQAWCLSSTPAWKK